MQSGSFALGATLALAGVVLGQVDSAAAQATGNQTETPAATQSGDTTPRRTANDLLKALRRSKPIRDLVSPAGTTDATSTPQPVALLPEGTAVVEWEGTLTKDGLWWTIIPESPANEPPTKILPNINLEVMTRTLVGESGPVRFSVSGEVTAFQGENFLLIRFVRRLANTPTELQPGPSATTGRPDTSTHNSPERPSASPEDVIGMIRDQKPRTVVSPAVPPPGKRRMADLSDPSLRSDGTAFAQRPGRLTRDDLWWRFSFETEHSRPEEPTIRLLPGRGLELMIQNAERTRDGLVLLVSGELTQFNAQNYLLPRSVIRRTGTDNLRK